MKRCKYCNSIVQDGVAVCPGCGAHEFEHHEFKSFTVDGEVSVEEPVEASPKSRAIALLLAILFGVMGFHRFYVGKIATGILYFFTGGLCGIGWVVDMIAICSGTFKDRDDRPLVNWEI